MKRSKFDMNGFRALVTGAGSGIGRSTAISLAKAGAKVALLSRSPEELEEVASQMGGEKAGHLILSADISKNDEMQSAFRQIEESWGRLDHVVANAGINGVWAPLSEIKVAEWEKTLGINLTGTFLTVKLALPFLKKSRGAVVIVSSVNGNRMFSNSGATAYACSKAAQVAFSRMTALEFAEHGIRVNAVCPGAIRTQIDDSTELRDIGELHLPVEFPEGQVPLNDGRAGSSEQVADAILYLLSDAASHVTGTEIYVDGAQSLFQG
ncbi:SDR family oxidoreductase [Haloferula chungangensis]|uniref:SDR family oxidoreductase n=1 Tax=Haloferula chungangensis TaxID=1048331 RepID=A0ABW2L3B6_9BACT